MDDEPPEHIDKKGILLKADNSRGEIGVLNPALNSKRFRQGWPFLYRTRRRDRDREYSTIDFKWLRNPKKLSKTSRTLVVPEHDFESWGCEDPRLTKIGDTFYITYVAYDGLNARIALATTKDFQTIEKQRIIGPNIPLEEAIEIVGDESYKRRWKDVLTEKEGKKKELGLKVDAFLYEKDASLHYQNKRWILIHRIDPNMHITFASSLDELKDQDFWREYLRTINENILIKPSKGWTSLKVGLGSPPMQIADKLIAVYHGVQRLNKSHLTYRGSFVELDPKTFMPISRLRSPLFVPASKDVLREYDSKGKLVGTKSISFPTAMLVDPSNADTLYIYSGKGDQDINFRSTSIPWLFEELDKPHNRIRTIE